MAVTINADNGAVSGSAGLKYSADNSGVLQLLTNGTVALTVNTSQNVGIGTSSPSTRLSLVGATNTGLAVNDGTVNTILYNSSSAHGTVGTTTNHPLAVFTNNAERMRINSLGKILFNTTTQNNNEQVGMVYSSNAGVGFSIKDSNAQNGNTFIEFRNGATVAGTITSNGTTTMTYGSASDYRLKENLTSLTNALAKILSLQPKVGNWKVDGSEFVGFVAHELQEVFPDAVVGEKDRVDADGNALHQMVDTGSASIIATLTAAIQEQQALITALTARITALENK